ncbi:MAG: flagellar export chaperone FliS [Clostridiales bacterium]|nr:flagellar export chaperone FliS [Clostridiales bacterium]
MQNNPSNAYTLYQQNEVLTASKGKLLIMLYDGSIKFLRLAKISIDEKNIENTNKYICKTENIISELMATLNMDMEISKNLYALYDYMKRSLMEANIKKDKGTIDEILSMVSELKDTWEEASRIAR